MKNGLTSYLNTLTHQIKNSIVIRNFCFPNFEFLKFIVYFYYAQQNISYIMRKKVRNFSEILNIPGVWIELYLNIDTGIWEISGAKYFVTLNSKIVDANTGELIDDNTIKEIDLENKKNNKYSWNCCYPSELH